MLTDGRTDGRTHGRKVITIAHPEQSSGELIMPIHSLQDFIRVHLSSHFKIYFRGIIKEYMYLVTILGQFLISTKNTHVGCGYSLEVRHF